MSEELSYSVAHYHFTHYEFSDYSLAGGGWVPQYQACWLGACLIPAGTYTEQPPRSARAAP